MNQDEQYLYFYKDSCIYTAILSDSLYNLQMLKPFDDRSRSTGAIGKRAVFNGGNLVFVVTGDNQIKSLQRIQQIDYPQLQPISYVIQPTISGYDFSDTAGIAFRDHAYIACKSVKGATVNDVVPPFNLVEGHWESPIVGWQVGEWAIYDNGDGEDLYFGDGVSPNVWKLTNKAIVDGIYQVTSFWKSKQFDFGDPTEQKKIEDLYIEGYISPTTQLTITMFLDENGYTGTYQTTFSGSETEFLMGEPRGNPLGINPLGTVVLGGSVDTSGLRKFRIHLSKDFRCLPFYNCQLQFFSTGINQRWEILRFGFLVGVYTQPTRRKLIRKFT